MSPLITDIPKSEVHWSKFKTSNMYNDKYYLRRTKFLVYQIATIGVGICSGIASETIKRYKDQRNRTVQEVPGTSVVIDDIIAIMALQIASAAVSGMVFSPGIYFDLFWPERWEAPMIQRAWKWSAMLACILQVAATIGMTVEISAEHIAITADDQSEWHQARALWKDDMYNYRTALLIATAVFAWIGLVFTFWSTVAMWMCYRHNNRHGPFNDHVVEEGSGSGGFGDENGLNTIDVNSQRPGGKIGRMSFAEHGEESIASR